MGFKKFSCSLMASRDVSVWKECFLGVWTIHYRALPTRHRSKPHSPAPPRQTLQEHRATQTVLQPEKSRFIFFHSSMIQPRDQDEEFSQQLATFCSKYVFYIRFAHQFASQWDECFSFLLRRKYQLFIAARGNNEWLQEPLDSRSPHKQIYKQSFSTTVLQDAKEDWARSVHKTFQAAISAFPAGMNFNQEISKRDSGRYRTFGVFSKPFYC